MWWRGRDTDTRDEKREGGGKCATFRASIAGEKRHHGPEGLVLPKGATLKPVTL